MVESMRPHLQTQTQLKSREKQVWIEVMHLQELKQNFLCHQYLHNSTTHKIVATLFTIIIIIIIIVINFVLHDHIV